MTTEVWIAVAMGVAVPVVLLLGRYAWMLRPRMVAAYSSRGHWPSICFRAYGVHLSEWLAYDIYQLNGKDPGAEPVFHCPCTCRMCSRGRCVEEYSMHDMLREQRARMSAGG